VIETTSVGAIPASARIAPRLAHTTSACSASASGTEPSGRIGTTPAVWSQTAAPSVRTAWA
jgi:hypothetical protein